MIIPAPITSKSPEGALFSLSREGLLAATVTIILLMTSPGLALADKETFRSASGLNPVVTRPDKIDMRTGGLSFSLPTQGLAGLGHSDQMLVIRYQNGNVITHRRVRAETLARLNIPSGASPRKLADKLLSPCENQSATDIAHRNLTSGWSLHFREEPNSAGFRTIVAIGPETIHYFDLIMPADDFHQVIDSFAVVRPTSTN